MTQSPFGTRAQPQMMDGAECGWHSDRIYSTL